MRTFPMATASLLAALAVLPARASAQDVDAMAKWTSYAVVHYHYVGTYSGETKVLVGTQGLYRVAPVTDRVEIDFDWDQNEMKLAGTPVIKNFPSTVGTPVPVNQCPPPRIEGGMPALESSHAIAYAQKLAPELGKDKCMVINLSGRGDKDLEQVARHEESHRGQP